MAFDKSFSDEIKKEIAYKEYEIESYNQDVRLKTGEYIGNVAHIYDNVNDNEEQVFVLTNNGKGAQQNAVPYTASDEDRAQIHDVTVFDEGIWDWNKYTKITPWYIYGLGKDRFASSFQYFEPGGASEYATEYAKNYARDKAKDSFNNAVEAFEDAIIPTSVNLPPEATPVGRFIQKAMDNPVSNFVQEKASDMVGFVAERTAEEQVKFPALMGAAFLKKYNDENGTSRLRSLKMLQLIERGDPKIPQCQDRSIRSLSGFYEYSVCACLFDGRGSFSYWDRNIYIMA